MLKYRHQRLETKRGEGAKRRRGRRRRKGHPTVHPTGDSLAGRSFLGKGYMEARVAKRVGEICHSIYLFSCSFFFLILPFLFLFWEKEKESSRGGKIARCFVSVSFQQFRFIIFEAKESRFLKFISSQFQNIKSKTFYGSARPESRAQFMKINSKSVVQTGWWSCLFDILTGEPIK